MRPKVFVLSPGQFIAATLIVVATGIYTLQLTVLLLKAEDKISQLTNVNTHSKL